MWADSTPSPYYSRGAPHLGTHLGMIFRNHGTLTVGRTVGEAFERMYVLEKACRIQVAALACGVAPVVPPKAAIECVFPQLNAFGDIAGITWAALLRRLERTAPDYRD